MNAPSLLLGLALIASASAAVAAPPPGAACQPLVEKAWIRAAPPGAMMLAGYATVRNPCPRAIAIVDVAAVDFASAMIHETLVENGVSKMRHADRLPVPARGALAFAPGGRHLMLMQPRRPLKAGERTVLTLLLADGRRLSAEFTVRRDAP
jgi:copper(I)-binding protein